MPSEEVPLRAVADEAIHPRAVRRHAREVLEAAERFARDRPELILGEGLARRADGEPCFPGDAAAAAWSPSGLLRFLIDDRFLQGEVARWHMRLVVTQVIDHVLTGVAALAFGWTPPTGSRAGAGFDWLETATPSAARFAEAARAGAAALAESPDEAVFRWVFQDPVPQVWRPDRWPPCERVVEIEPERA